MTTQTARALERLRIFARVGGCDMEPVRRVLALIEGPPFAWREPWRTPEDEWCIEEARQRALKEPPR